jgi:hypothetical protein
VFRGKVADWTAQLTKLKLGIGGIAGVKVQIQGCRMEFVGVGGSLSSRTGISRCGGRGRPRAWKSAWGPSTPPLLGTDAEGFWFLGRRRGRAGVCHAKDGQTAFGFQEGRGGIGRELAGGIQRGGRLTVVVRGDCGRAFG